MSVQVLAFRGLYRTNSEFRGYSSYVTQEVIDLLCFVKCQWIRPICKLPGGNHGVLPLQTPQGKLINEVLVVFKSQGFMYDFLQKGNPKFKGQEVMGQPLILTELVMVSAFIRPCLLIWFE